MPAFIESPPPTIVGNAELSGISPEARDFSGYLRFVYDGEQTTNSNSRPSSEVDELAIVDEYAPVWQPADVHFRESRGLEPDRPVKHSLTVENADILHLPPQIRKQTSGLFLHIDKSERSDAVQRYTFHSAASTDFYIGKRWFSLVRPVATTDNAGVLRILATGVGSLLNTPILIAQARRALYYQPEAGSIVAVDSQVHAASRRLTGPDYGKLIINNVQVVD